MQQRYSCGASTNISHFLSLLFNAIGPSAFSDYNGIANGSIIIPHPNSLGDNYIFHRIEQEQFHLGFSESSFYRLQRETLTPSHARLLKAACVKGM
jgi:hypothetical protein